MNANVVTMPREVELGGIGGPPEHMTEDAQKAWNDVVSSCPGTFIRSDRLILELLATTLARYRVSPNRQTRRLLDRLFKECLVPRDAWPELMGAEI